VEQEGLRLPGGAAARGGDVESGDGGETGLDLLLAGAEVAPADPAAALAAFAEVLAGWPDDPAAPAALAETGLIVTQANASPDVQTAARRLREAEAEGGRPALAAAALGALAAARHREGDVAGALAATEALVALGDSLGGGEDGFSGDTPLFGHVASVYLYAEAGRMEEATAALAALEAAAPGSVEAELARWHLEGLGDGAGGRLAAPEVAGGPQAQAAVALAGEVFRLEPARPNPAASAGGVSVPFVLSERAHVRV